MLAPFRDRHWRVELFREGVGKVQRHGFLPVNHEGPGWRIAQRREPFEQLPAVGMRREAFDRLDSRVQGIPLAEDPDRIGAGLDHLPERPRSLVIFPKSKFPKAY